MTIGKFLTQYAGALFGFLDAAPAAGLAYVGSAKGTSIAGEAGADLLTEDPPQFSKCIILQVIPGTQSLYGLAISFSALTRMGLFDGTMAEPSIANGLLILVACLSMTIGGLLSDITQGRVAVASVNIMTKNPNDWSKGMVLCIIVEFYAILSLLISFPMIMFGFWAEAAMDGIEKITRRIAADTEAEIVVTRTEARRQADEIITRYEAQARREVEEIAACGCRSTEERQARPASVARLDARKLELAAKQEMLAKAYDRAMKRLISLPDGECVGLLAGLAAEAPSTGQEEVILSQKDRVRYGKQAVTQANEKPRDGHLTLSVQTRPIRGELILNDGDVGTNCTFETLVRLLWGEMDRTVVEVSFG